MAKQKKRRSSTRRSNGELERSYRSLSGGKYSKKSKKLNKITSVLTVCIAVLAIAAIIAGSIFIYNLDRNSTLQEGVTIAGVDVGGMTKSQAIEAVTVATENTYTKNTMVVTVLDTTVEIKPYLSQAKLDVRAAVKAAFKLEAPGAVDLSDYLNLDENAIRNVLNELGSKYSSTLSQTKVTVMGAAPSQVMVINVGVPEYGLDMNKLYQQVMVAYSNNTFTAVGECELITPAPIDLTPYWEQYYVAPVSATLDSQTHTVIPSVDGYGFDLVAAQKQLNDAQYGAEIEIPFTAIKPTVTTESLNSSLYRETLASWEAVEANSDANRNTNLKLACEAINGLILYPGETFSYNNALGERTEERGYRPGPSIENGKISTTIGGGICQVSSALYYCALLSDLEIVERESHRFAVSYVPLGMDAAVSWGYLDFRFKNNTNYPIRIEASANGGTVNVSLVGTDEKDYYVEMEYEVKATYGYDTVYETMAPDNEEGYKNGDYIVNPHTGYLIHTYRCTYKKGTATKEQISRVAEEVTKYEKCDAVVCVISEESTEDTPGIGNGNVTEDGAS